MHSTKVDYAKLLAGEYTKPRMRHPVESFFAARGATVRSNVFFDPGLHFNEDFFLNMIQVVRCGREQGFQLVVLAASRDLDKYCLKTSLDLMNSEKVIIHLDSNHETKINTYNIYYPDLIWLIN